MLVRGGIERDEDETDASETDDLMHSRGSLPARDRPRQRRRRSRLSDGVSPAASLESLTDDGAPGVSGSRHALRDGARGAPASAAAAAAANSALPAGSAGAGPGFTSSLLGTTSFAGLSLPRAAFDDGTGRGPPPPTWTRLVEGMRRAVESYRQAIANADRAEYVHRAEDISDHLRLLLAAASGTTDNHSGTPSVIGANKALYPHFRDMMSRFSKLVLSSHIAAADWPAPDAYGKCLQEADGVLTGVYNFVEVARAQRGEDLPRLLPGFVLGRPAGGAWLANNVPGSGSWSDILPTDQDAPAPHARPDERVLERLDERKRLLVASLRRLEEHLIVPDKLVNPQRHEIIATGLCAAAAKVVEHVRTFLATLEAVNLAPVVGGNPSNAPLADFNAQKQRLYDLVAGFVIACQTVAAPLADEWADLRGEPLSVRLGDVQVLTRQLETALAQARAALQLLAQSAPSDKPGRDTSRRIDSMGAKDHAGARNDALTAATAAARRAPGLDAFGGRGVDNQLAENQLKNTKLQRIFGFEPPAVAGSPTAAGAAEETPAYLRLDHEDEMAFDAKVDPPALRGGTLAALVEQLTRHDRPQPQFISTFLLTYRSFTSAAELFEMLVRRFSIQPPRGLPADAYRVWVERKQKPIRLRVVNILKTWLESYWMEGSVTGLSGTVGSGDAGSEALLRRIHAFARDSLAPSAIPGSNPLLAAVEQRLRGQDPAPRVLVLNVNKDQAPQPIVPKNMKKLKFLDIDAAEFARQLTIIESRLYGKIRPTECLNKTWQKKLGEGEPDPAPNVKALILHSNQLTNWVAEMILTQSDVKKRVVVIKHFVSVADVRSTPFRLLLLRPVASTAAIRLRRVLT